MTDIQFSQYGLNETEFDTLKLNKFLIPKQKTSWFLSLAENKNKKTTHSCGNFLDKLTVHLESVHSASLVPQFAMLQNSKLIKFPFFLFLFLLFFYLKILHTISHNEKKTSVVQSSAPGANQPPLYKVLICAICHFPFQTLVCAAHLFPISSSQTPQSEFHPSLSLLLQSEDCWRF